MTDRDAGGTPALRRVIRWTRAPRPVLAIGLLVLGAAAVRSAPRPPAPVWAVCFNPDGKTLAAGTHRRVVLFDLETKTAVRALPGHAGPVRCLAWSPDGRRLAAGGGKPGEQGEILLWSMSDPMPAAAALREHRDVVEGLAFALSGDVLVSAGSDEKAVASAVESRSVVRALADHTNRVSAVAVSPDGRYVATGSLDRTVKIWSAADYSPLANLDANGGAVYAVAFLAAFSVGGSQVAAAGEDGNLRIYRLSETKTGSLVSVNGTVVRTMSGNRTPIFALAAAPKGGLIAYGGEERVVHVVDAATGTRKHALKECTGAVYSVAFSSDGALVAAGCRDGKARVWSAADGKLIAELVAGDAVSAR